MKREKRSEKRTPPRAAVLEPERWATPPVLGSGFVKDGSAWTMGVPSLAELAAMMAQPAAVEAVPDESWRFELGRREQAADWAELAVRSRMWWEIRRGFGRDDVEQAWRRRVADLVEKRAGLTSGRGRQDVEGELLKLGVVVIDHLDAVYAATLEERRNGAQWAYDRLRRLAEGPPRPVEHPGDDDARRRALLLGQRIAALRSPGPSTAVEDRDQVRTFLKGMADLASNHRLMVEAELFDMAHDVEKQLAADYGAVLRNGKAVGGFPDELAAVLEVGVGDE